MAESYSDYFRQLSEGSKKKSGRRSKSGGYVLPSSEDFPVNVADPETFKQLLGQLRSVQKSKLGLTALGQEPETQARPGILEKLFGQEKGILTTPFRFVSAGLADVFNLPVQDEEAQAALEKYNPLQAAFKSATGEFAVTGGDLFKVKEDDSFIEKLGKYAGALAFDVTLDPINWFGPQALLGRKGAAVILAQQGDALLPKLASAMAEEGLDATKVIDNLFTSSKPYKVALAGDVNLIERFGIIDGVVTNVEQKTKTAAQALSNYVAEVFYKEGRQGLKKSLVSLVGNEAAADRFFKSLPKDIAGGLFVKNPITGKPIARIAGGTGKTVPGFEKATELANAARFATATSKPAQFITTHFNTRIGPTFARVKKGMIGGVGLGQTDRTLLYEFVNFKNELRKNRIEIYNLGKEAAGVLSAARGAKIALGNDAERTAYDLGIKTRFHNPQLPLAPDATLAQKSGDDIAINIREMLNKRHEDLKAAGFTIGDLGPDWVPTRWTREHRKWLADQGIDFGADEYSLAQGRVSEVRFMDPEQAKFYGFTTPTDPDIVFLTGVKLNEISGVHPAGHKIWLEDPIEIAADYMESTGRALAAKRFADGLRAADVLYTIPDNVTEALKAKNTAYFIASLESVPAKTRAYWAEVEKANEQQLQEILDRGEFIGTQAAARYERASAQYEEANNALQLAQRNIVEANAQVKRLRPQVEQIEADLEAFFQSGAGQADESAQRALANARARRSKASARLNRATEAMDESRMMADLAEQIGSAGDIAATSVARDAAEAAAQARVAKFEEEFFNVEDAVFEAQTTRAVRENARSFIAENRLTVLREFEEALSLQVRAANTLKDAFDTRRAAAREATLALKGTSISRAHTLKQLALDYKDAMVQVRRVEAQIGAAMRPTKDKAGNIVRKMTKEQYKALNQAKRVAQRQRDLLKKMVGYSTRKDSASLTTEYYKLLMTMLDTLTKDEFNAIRSLTDADTIDNFVNSLRGADPTTQMQAIGDMVASYRNIRGRIKYEDIRRFAEMDADALRGSPLKQITRKRVERQGVSALLKTEKQQPEAVTKLYNQEGFVKYGSGENKGTVRVPLSLKDSYAARGVIGVLEDMHKVQENPGDWEGFIKNLYDPLALVWKTGATAARGPAFILNNIVGGIYNNYIAGVSARDHARAARAINKLISITRKIQKENPDKAEVELIDLVAERIRTALSDDNIHGVDLGNLFVQFLERGGQMGTDTAWQLQEIGRLGLETSKPVRRATRLNVRYADAPTNKSMEWYLKAASYLLDNRVQRKFNDWSQNSEVFLRFAAFVSGWRRYKNIDSAMDLTYMLHFDYQDLSTAEIWLKRFMPFYTWNRYNVPLQLRSLFLAPDRVGKLFNATENAKEAFGVDGDAEWLQDYMPDWLTTQSGFITDFKFGGNHLALYPRLPLIDLEKLFAVGYIGPIPVILPRKDEFFNTLGPAIKSPVEVLTNRNFTLGYEYKSTADMLLAQGRNIFPYAGTAKRLLSAAGLPIEKEKRVSNLINVILGTPFGATTITEKSLYGEAWRDSMSLAAQLKKASVEAGVDYEWLVKQLGKGMTLDQVVALILSGQGSIETVSIQNIIKEAQKAKKGESTDYAAVLRGLQTGQLLTGL